MNIKYSSYIFKSKADYFAVSIITAITFFVFRTHISGEKSPTWDFLGAYLTNSVIWWDSGSFFSPPSYLPYAFSGYPAQALAQSSGWYLPYWFLAEVNSLSSYTLVVLQVFTILFGTIGFYFLMRKYKFDYFLSLVLGLAYLFSPGFFSNASHVDIVRSWAFLPWIFIILTPWAKYSTSRIILTAIFIFQFAISVYPGTLVASLYIFLIYFFLIYLFYKPKLKEYLLFQIAPMFIGVLLSLLKWLPLITEDRIDRGGNTVVVNLGIIATLIYPYETSALPNDLTMRSLYISPLIVLSLLLINRFSKEVKIFSIIAVFSVLFAVDFGNSEPWQRFIPLMDQSRFRTTDFKPFFSISIIFLGGCGIRQALKSNFRLVKVGAIGIAAFFYFQVLNFFAKESELETFILASGNRLAKIIGISFIFVLVLLWLNARNQTIHVKNFIYILYFLVTIWSGYTWIMQTPSVWLQNRVEQEKLYYGEQVEKILEESKNYRPLYRTERIGREFPVPYPSEFTIQMWNKSELEKSFSSGGLVSLKGLLRYEDFIQLALSEQGVSYHSLLRNPLSVWLVDQDKANLQTANCITNQDCLITSAELNIFDWGEDHFSVDINSLSAGLLVANEVSWRGWRAKLCTSLSCEDRPVATEITDKLIAIPISTDTKLVTFYYAQPYKFESWTAFWLGLVLLFLLTIVNKKKLELAQSKNWGE